MHISLDRHTLSRTYDTQPGRSVINKGVHQGRHMETMRIGKKVQSFFVRCWNVLTESPSKKRALSLSRPAEVVSCETSAPISNRNDPNIRTYGKFAMENHISSRKAQSFLARWKRSLVRRLSVIQDLRCFRRPTKTHKPSDVNIAAYRELRQKKVALAFKITKQFVKELESNYPKTWFALNKYDHLHLREISAKSPELTMPAILSGAHRSTSDTNDRALNSKFSSNFLLLMQALETEIVASFEELAEQ